MPSKQFCVRGCQVKNKKRKASAFRRRLRLLREYAAHKGIVIIHEFIDVESSKAGGRAGFSQMVAFLKKHPGCRTILVEKTDRLYRNLTDYATLDELGVTIHLVKENQIIGPDSKSSEQFVHGIKVLMARNYSQNLGEETIKGMTEKARAGIYPSCAPVGYRNADGPDGKRVIILGPGRRADDYGAVRTICHRPVFRKAVSVRELNAEGLKLARAQALQQRRPPNTQKAAVHAVILTGMARRTMARTNRW